MAVEVAQRSRGGGGGGGDPFGGGCAAQSHGKEIVVIFFLIFWSTYSASSSRFFAVANATSFVRSRRVVPPLVFLVLVLVALRCCVEIALLVESIVHTMQASKRFPALLRTRHPSQLIRRRRRHVRPSSSSRAPTPLAMRMDLAANTTAESSQTRLTDLQILLRNLLRFTPPPLPHLPPPPPVNELLGAPPDCHDLIRPSQGSDRLRSDFGVRVGLMAVVKATVVIIVGLRVVILCHVTRVSVASCRHCYALGDR